MGERKQIEKQPDKQGITGRDERGRWVSGISGNPYGRPKFSLVSILGELLQEIPEGEREIKARQLMKKAIDMAMGGDTAMLRDIINRIDGMPKEKIEMEGEIEHRENKLIDLLKDANKETRKKVVDGFIEILRERRGRGGVSK
jgi:hypothetical protein